MNESEFERDYPKLYAILPTDLLDGCEEGHLLKLCVERDRHEALELWSNLVENSPAGELIKTYENNLHKRDKFNAFVAELWCYQALKRWLCDDPQVLDMPSNQGMPDFACDDFDVDATLLQEAEEEYRIRRKLEDVMENRPYVGILYLKSDFDVQATTGLRWGKNEAAVDEFINLIDADLEPDNPKTLETTALRLEFKQVQKGPFRWMVTWDSARKIEPDDENKIPERLRTKKNQPRDDRPLVIFIDCKHTSIDFVEEVRDTLIGEPYGFCVRSEVEISRKVTDIPRIWDDYLVEIGAIPDPSDNREIAHIQKDDDSGVATHKPFSAIRPGDEGVFSESDLAQIAGVMLRMKNGEVCYFPNVYTTTVDAKSIYDKVNWGLDTRMLSPEGL